MISKGNYSFYLKENSSEYLQASPDTCDTDLKVFGVYNNDTSNRQMLVCNSSENAYTDTVSFYVANISNSSGAFDIWDFNSKYLIGIPRSCNGTLDYNKILYGNILSLRFHFYNGDYISLSNNPDLIISTTTDEYNGSGFFIFSGTKFDSFDSGNRTWTRSNTPIQSQVANSSSNDTTTLRLNRATLVELATQNVNNQYFNIKDIDTGNNLLGINSSNPILKWGPPSFQVNFNLTTKNIWLNRGIKYYNDYRDLYNSSVYTYYDPQPINTARFKLFREKTKGSKNYVKVYDSGYIDTSGNNYESYISHTMSLSRIDEGYKYIAAIRGWISDITAVQNGPSDSNYDYNDKLFDDRKITQYTNNSHYVYYLFCKNNHFGSYVYFYDTDGTTPENMDGYFISSFVGESAIVSNREYSRVFFT